MKFEDPTQVVCECCNHRSLLPEKQLLQLQASCPNCHQSLAAIGLQMRAMLDDWHAFTLLIEIVVEIENAMNITISDAELEGVQTLRQLAYAIEGKLTREHGVSPALDVVERAARTVTEVEILNYDVNILESLQPNRWS
jgi:hypothetical protein